MPCSLESFPQLTEQEFQQACNNLVDKFHRYQTELEQWLTVETIQALGSSYLRITARPPAAFDVDKPQHEVDEVEEIDDEIICTPPSSPVLMQYDVLLSPVYQVPVLYIDILDSQYRFPPTMETLYKYVVPSHFQPEIESVGVIGGITVNHHPVSNKPMFSIHPCQTADLMKAIVGERYIDSFEYLVIWIGAIGKCAGLNVPLSFANGQEC